MPQSKSANFLVQRRLMAAETGTKGLAATHENTGLARTVTGTAATFLIAKLLCRTVDFTARLGLMGTLLALVELPLDNPVNNVNARLRPKMWSASSTEPAFFASIV
jgi:hypothetical protein